MNRPDPIRPAAAMPVADPHVTLPDRAQLARLVHAIERRIAPGTRLSKPWLRTLFEAGFGGPDGPERWNWRLVQDCVEAAIARYCIAHPCASIIEARALDAVLPAASHRSEHQLRLQQFSTPPTVAFLLARAAALTPGMTVLEPSAGTGLLAAAATGAGRQILANELDPVRAMLVGIALDLSVDLPVSRHDAIRIGDLVPRPVERALMNPPFRTSALRQRRREEWADHLSSAWSALRPSGRLAALLPAKAFADGHRDPKLPNGAALRAAITLPRTAFQPSGTQVPIRLVVLDRKGGAHAAIQHAAPCNARSLDDVLTMLADIPEPETLDEEASPGSRTPVRLPRRPAPRSGLRLARHTPQTSTARRPAPSTMGTAQPLPVAYRAVPDVPGSSSDGIYQPWRARIDVDGAEAHPTPLVVSAAMAAIRPALPDVSVCLPPHVFANGVLANGMLSDAQAETLVLAEAAFARDLPGRYIADPATGAIATAPEGQGDCFRQGFFLGDGTGVGKGRQVASLFLAARASGAVKGVWISRSDTLVQDARRDWTALGGSASEIIAQSAWKPQDPITALAGIVFTTYATLRQEGRADAPSRLEQLTAWLGPDFDGLIAFDEAHAMANALSAKGETAIGVRARTASKQGIAGVRLQAALPRARILYVSATGASAIASLAFAPRLGLWGGPNAPFANVTDFIAAMEAGGVAALEMICRDLARLGRYQARALSFEGVDYQPLEHRLTPRDIATWDSWAEAFQVLHRNLDAALKATGILDANGTSRNSNAKAAALSAFESMKQRFFGQLLMSMKLDSLIPAIEEDLAQDRAAIVQIVSTSEAVLERRLAGLTDAELAAGEIDTGPADLVMDYVAASFPVTAMQITSDADGREVAEPMFDDAGNPVISRAAAQMRDALLERLGALPEITGALDRLIEHFGIDAVAECTGRSRRIVPDPADPARRRIARRSANANAAEATAFQSGQKRILIFSEAGGTGRSYHADAQAGNRARRVHYLLEPGWRADLAIQGLGRSHRSNQVHPPVFRPVTTDVKGERRFLSTIARRLDALGALTRGLRETGGQNLFRPEDNLESPEAAAALRIFFVRLARGDTNSIGLCEFIDRTGLTRILDADGALRDDLPPMRQFLNRLLALPIATQNAVFEEFFDIVKGRVEAARQAGTLDLGIETLRSDHLRLLERMVVATDPASGATTQLVTLEMREANTPRDPDQYGDQRRRGIIRPFVNTMSSRAALIHIGPSMVLDDGSVQETVRILKPFAAQTITTDAFDASHWDLVDETAFRAAWSAEVDAAPEFQITRVSMLTGLLLPHWHRLGKDDVRVRRAILDDGTVLLGRLVEESEIPALCSAFGVTAPTLAPEDMLDAVLKGQTMPVGQGRALRTTTVAGGARMEITGFEPTCSATILMRHARQSG